LPFLSIFLTVDLVFTFLVDISFQNDILVFLDFNMSSLATRNIAIPTVEALTSCYMPFLKNGGLFIPEVIKDLAVGQGMVIMLKLPNSDVKMPVMGKICWITPPRCRHGKEGFGISFDEHTGNAKCKMQIEAMIRGRNQKTHTL